MLHATNPYGSKTGYDYYDKSFKGWLKKIMLLLNSHEIHLIDETNFWVLHMKEDGDNYVHYYEFELVTEDK